jgi:uncharacterized membrane protein YagU involved in acid resistance
MRRYSAASAILIGGLIAGTLDILYATGFSAMRGVAPTRILQSVASGLLGAAAYEGGTATAVLGLVLHFLMALLIAAIFCFASRRLTLLVRRPVLWGAAYGFVVYAVMNLVVIPLSAFPTPLRFVPIVVATGLFVHMFLVGVPIALAARRSPAEPVS